MVSGRFYGSFKVHKKYEHGSSLTIRGIVSYSGTLTENIAIFVENKIKEIGQLHDTNLQDTPDFLRYIEDLTQESNFSDDTLLVVIDVVVLYDNIPPIEGVTSVGEALTERPNIRVPTEFTKRLLQIILDYSVFEFNEKKYKQKLGTSMGSKPAPHYSDIFMARK